MLDPALFRLLYGWLHQAPWLQVMQWATHLGATRFVLALACGLLVESAIARARAKEGPPPLVASWLGIPAAAMLARCLKLLVKRPRPTLVYPELGLLPGRADFSFPSGHATLAFALATALSLRWPKGRYWWFGCAALVALSRVALGVHWPTDVVVGAVIGWGAVRAAAWAEQQVRGQR